MPEDNPRMVREARTIAAMIEIYCADQHGTRGALCPDCSEMLAYARARLQHCPFQENKTTCANCAVHCYKPAMRERIRVVMRHAGPRMLLRHPVLAVRHLLDGRRRQAVRPRRQMPAAKAAENEPAGRDRS